MLIFTLISKNKIFCYVIQLRNNRTIFLMMNFWLLLYYWMLNYQKEFKWHSNCWIFWNIREYSKKFKKIQDFVTFCSIWQFDVLKKSKVLSQSKAFLNWIGFVQSRKINFTPLFSSNKKIGFLRFCCTAFRIS